MKEKTEIGGPDPQPRLSELDSVGRASLAQALERLRENLFKLQGGAQFCEDRQFGWSLESEKGYREAILAAFKANPVLKRLMHDTWVLLANGRTVGDAETPVEELDVACAALTGKRAFAWHVGEGLGEERHELVLGPCEIGAVTRTVDSKLDGKPFAHDERRMSYEALGELSTSNGFLKGIPSEAYAQMRRVYSRFRGYWFNCDLCNQRGSYVGFAAGHTKLESSSPLGQSLSRPVTSAEAERIQRALLEHDIRVIHELEPAMSGAYCPACDHVYCVRHCRVAFDGPEYAATESAICCSCGKGREFYVPLRA